MQRILAAACLTHLIAAPAPAQDILRILGPSFDGQLGVDLDGCGDVNGDGVPDFVAGEPDANNGRARVYSGVDASIIYTFAGTFPPKGFGRAVAGLGDIDGDGRGDIAVGSWLDDDGGNDAGKVSIYSGLTGNLLREILGPEPDGVFGIGLAALGDVSGDGVPDLAVAAPNTTSPSLPGSGQILVHSGADGSQLYSIEREPGDLSFSRVIGNGGDTNGDGFDDILVGLSLSGGGIDQGEVRVYSGFDGTLLLSVSNPIDGDLLGRSVAGVGDWNGDGFGDFAGGAPGYDLGDGRFGLAQVFSGLDGSILRAFPSLYPSEQAGESVAGLGDVDGDGTPDLAIGSNSADLAGDFFGQIRIHSGASGRLLSVIHGDERLARFAARLAPMGDLDRDGAGELLCGAPFHGGSTSSAPGPGAVFVYSTDFSAFEPYCFADGSGAGCPCGNLDPDGGCANSSNSGARIVTGGTASISADHLQITVVDCPKMVSGIVFMGTAPNQLPLADGALCVGGSIQRFAGKLTTTFGAFTYEAGLPVSVTGLTESYFQAWFRDNGGTCGSGSNLSNALRVTWTP